MGQVKQAEMKLSVNLSAQGNCPMYPQGAGARDTEACSGQYGFRISLSWKCGEYRICKHRKKPVTTSVPVLYKRSLWLLEILFPSAVKLWQILGGWGMQKGDMSIGAPSPAPSLVSVCAKPPQTFLFIKLQGTSLVWSGDGNQAGVGTTGGHV